MCLDFADRCVDCSVHTGRSDSECTSLFALPKRGDDRLRASARGFGLAIKPAENPVKEILLVLLE